MTETRTCPSLYTPATVGNRNTGFVSTGNEFQNIDQSNTHLFSNAISLATTTVQELHEVQIIIDRKYVSFTEARLIDSGKSTPHFVKQAVLC